MFRNGAKSIAGLSGRTSRIAKALPAFKWSGTGAARPSFRCFSASSAVSDAVTDATTVSTPDLIPVDIDAIGAISDGLVKLSSADLGYYPSHIFMQVIDNVHLAIGIPYWEAIIFTTVALRVIIFPLSVITIKSAAAMSAMRPHMQKIKEAHERSPYASDPGVKAKYDQDVRAMFTKWKVNPLKSLAMPLIQLPLFLSFYWALSNMGLYYPDYAMGGDLWFQDLTACDPYYILPFLNALSFLAMVELGADGIQTENQEMFKWGMRGLAVAIGPLTCFASAGVFMYWVTNNGISLLQTQAMKYPPIRTQFGIAEAPKKEDTPLLKVVNPFRRVADEVIKATTANSPNTITVVDKKEFIAPEIGPPPKTFSSAPRKQKHMKK